MQVFFSLRTGYSAIFHDNRQRMAKRPAITNCWTHLAPPILTASIFNSIQIVQVCRTFAYPAYLDNLYIAPIISIVLIFRRNLSIFGYNGQRSRMHDWAHLYWSHSQ
jgi:hypothetical protein